MLFEIANYIISAIADQILLFTELIEIHDVENLESLKKSGEELENNFTKFLEKELPSEIEWEVKQLLRDNIKAWELSITRAWSYIYNITTVRTNNIQKRPMKS